MRVIAPVDTSGAQTIRVATAMAGDPLSAQYRLAVDDRAQAECIGPFSAWDPDHGAWPLSDQQRGILHEVLNDLRRRPDWINSVLVPVVERDEAVAAADTAEPSLRILDWFVTNYAKSRAVFLDGINIHEHYIDTRRAYACRNFDPFRRNLKLTFVKSTATEPTELTTTVGQLNFILWADAMGVLAYVRQHRDAIDADMRHVCTINRERRKNCRQNGTKHKRTALSTARPDKCRLLATSSQWVQPGQAAGRNAAASASAAASESK